MPSRSNHRHTLKLGRHAADLAFAVPEVMTHRIGRMMQAGASPSPRDRREFHLMCSEKVAAFHESWAAMYLEMFLANQRLSLELLRSFWLGAGGTRVWSASPIAECQRYALGVMASGMTPIRRRAVANAKRLRRVK